ncbi:hypothetical protein ACV8UO_04795 [Citrobacter freundii]
MMAFDNIKADTHRECRKIAVDVKKDCWRLAARTSMVPSTGTTA